MSTSALILRQLESIRNELHVLIIQTFIHRVTSGDVRRRFHCERGCHALRHKWFAFELQTSLLKRAYQRGKQTLRVLETVSGPMHILFWHFQSVLINGFHWGGVLVNVCVRFPWHLLVAEL